MTTHLGRLPRGGSAPTAHEVITTALEQAASGGYFQEVTDALEAVYGREAVHAAKSATWWLCETCGLTRFNHGTRRCMCRKGDQGK